MKDVLNTITKLRLERGWSEYKLAVMSELPQSTISAWYRSTKQPSLYSLQKVCDAYGITMSQLFAEGKDPVTLTDAQREMLDRWSRLTKEQQDALSRFLDTLS